MVFSRRKTGALAAALLASAFVPRDAQAKRCEDVAMPDEVSVDGKKLVLNGMGVREATVFNVNVYVAGLYLEKRSNDGPRIAAAEEIKRIDLAFVREVSREDMTEAIHKGFEKSAGAEFAKLKPRVEKFKALLPEFKVGDRLTLTYRPGSGLSVVAPGKKGNVEGADFARALFLIWLGAHPPNEGLKRGLLGGACG